MFLKFNNFITNITVAAEEKGLTKEIVSTMTGWLGGLPAELIVFIISLFPILECRGGILAATILNEMDVPINIWVATIISVIGNLLPIPFIFLFIEKIFAFLKVKTKRIGKLITKLENKAMSKSEKVTKYKRFGLLFFVGIPLPGTGAWTGALIAVLLKLNLKDSVVSIFLGVIMATAIMSIISYGIPALF